LIKDGATKKTRKWESKTKKVETCKLSLGSRENYQGKTNLIREVGLIDNH
jgi:hypothetical protein